MQKQLGRKLPEMAYSGEAFEIHQHGQLYGAVAVDDLALWAARIEHQDSGVPTRTWSVDIALRRVGDESIFVLRNLATTAALHSHPVPFTLPTIVRMLSKDIGILNARPIDGRPWMLSTSADLDDLQRVLTDRNRRLPLVLLTEADESKLSYKVDRFVLDPIDLAGDLHALAIVAAMPRELGFEWTRRVTKPWSAFNGSVRTYRPRVDFAKDDPFRHPLAGVNDIVMWSFPTTEGSAPLSAEPAFRAFLKEKAFQTITSAPLMLEENLFYRNAKSMTMVSQLRRVSDTAGWEKIYEETLADKDAEIEQARGEMQFAYDQTGAVEEENQSLKQQIYGLRAHEGTEDSIPIPAELDELSEWKSHVANQVVFAQRALKGAAESVYENPRLVYRCLLVLANEYRDMKIEGGLSRKASYEKAIEALGVRDGGSITLSRAGEQGQQYFVPHPLNPSREVFLDQHLWKSKSRDGRLCLRIYFGWDADEKVVIIGWLTSHLDNRLS